MKLFISVLGVLFSFQVASAQVEFGQIISAGTGCNANDSAPLLTIKEGKGRLTLSSLNIALSANDSALMAREACNVRLPVSIQKGYQVGIRIADANGVLNQPRRVKTTITGSASLVSKLAEQTVTSNYESRVKGRYKVSNRSANDAITWSACSDKDVNTMIALSANIITVREKTSAIVNATMTSLNFNLLVRACDSLN